MNPLGGGKVDMQANPLGGNTIVNPLNPGVNQAPKQKLEEMMELPKEYKNEYLERLGKSPGFTDETSLFE